MLLSRKKGILLQSPRFLPDFVQLHPSNLLSETRELTIVDSLPTREGGTHALSAA